MSTTTTTVSVSELSGPALDWAVAKCEGIESFVFVERDVGQKRPLSRWCGVNVGLSGHERFCPSSDWSLAGPIIERCGIELQCWGLDGWGAKDTNYQFLNTPDERDVFAEGFGPTPLIAAMRCYVASKLGATVDVPCELV